ncbi:Transcriptional regulation of mitochondrial recombination domain containing protein [Elaphomyces granulatus]
MASIQPVQKPIQKVLDPTKIATWELVRRPLIPRGTVIQGRARTPGSNAYKSFQWKEGGRLRKALNRITHGKNIFAYNNIRTNQVVYSLTRYLEKSNVLLQLLYHGKKTVPATLRKDMWVPFYSVHFNDAKLGLQAYRLLREFSLRRQLSPPKELIAIPKEYAFSKWRPKDSERKVSDKVIAKERKKLVKKVRARLVMDQKATSVADIAAVLAIQEENDLGEDGKTGYLSRTARKRRREARRKEQEVAERAAERVENFSKLLSTPAAEYKVEEVQEDEAEATQIESNEIKILWADVYDAQYAQSWPGTVRHGELERRHDHVMSGQKRIANAVLANNAFMAEKALKSPE